MKKVVFAENETSYVIPQVEIIEVEVEKGFATSTGTGGSLDDGYEVGGEGHA